MTKTELAQEALTRAMTQQALTNYPAIFEGFTAKGIAEADILPRENIFTFHAWRALGRTVRRGERGVRITTYVPMTKRSKDAKGEETVETFRRPKAATVFHVTQTKQLEG